MIHNNGALGDTGYAVPALNILRDRYDKIFMCGDWCVAALENTGLVDWFVVKPGDFEEWDEEKKRRWLAISVPVDDFDALLSCSAVVPSVYMFKRNDPRFEEPVEWKRENAKGVNFFDEMSKKLGVPEAIGKRPVTQHTPKERKWLKRFRERRGIPKDAFILGWQFTGSAEIKWYPFFNMVVQRYIMPKYPQVYVVAMGDMKNKLKWDRKYHGGRYINLTDTVSFRQAYILISSMDCLVGPETGVMVFAQGYPDVPKVLLATHTDGSQWTFPETEVIQSTADCAPCYNIVSTCTRDGENPWAYCMGKIDPVRVIEAIEGVICAEEMR